MSPLPTLERWRLPHFPDVRLIQEIKRHVQQSSSNPIEIPIFSTWLENWGRTASSGAGVTGCFGWLRAKEAMLGYLNAPPPSTQGRIFHDR